MLEAFARAGLCNVLACVAQAMVAAEQVEIDR